VGKEVSPYVVATFRLLTATLDTLPEPAFPNDAYAHEKIELGE
jgi:probable lipoprotein (TIGR04455 family)